MHHRSSLRGATRRRFHGEWIAPKSEARRRLLKPLNLETTMLLDHPSDGPTAIRTQFGAIFVSLELSRSTWLVALLAYKAGEPRVCAMVVAPSPEEEEDRRRLCRERRALVEGRLTAC